MGKEIVLQISITAMFTTFIIFQSNLPKYNVSKAEAC